MNEKIRDKKVEESITETKKLLQYREINGQNRLFGGRFIEWMDEVAALTAMRHCGGLVTTCAVYNLRFKYGAYINEIIVLIGEITYVGNTSMEVRVGTYVEDIETGIRCAINPVCGVIISDIVLKESRSLGVQAFVALVFVCWGIYAVNRKELDKYIN